MRRAAGRVARAAREPVSLRTTLLLMMLAAGVYSAGLPLYLFFRVRSAALALGAGTEAIVSLQDDQARRNNALDHAASIARHLVESRTPPAPDTLNSMVHFVAVGGGAGARPYATIPGPLRAELARSDEAMSQMGTALAEQVSLLRLGRWERDTILWLVLGALAVPLVAYLIRRRVWRPLAELEDGLARVAEGDLTTQVSVRGRDELGRLAQHFNEMTRVLRDRAEEQGRFAAAGELLAGVAHEVNNPLMAIAAHAENRIADGAATEEQRSEMLQILRQARRAAKLLRGLLRFVRSTEREVGRVNLNDVVRGGMDLVSYRFGLDEIAVGGRLDPNLLPVEGDAIKLEQVIVNLLSNAIDALRGIKPPRQLTVDTWVENGRVCVAVADNGRGVSPDVMARLFRPFATTKGRRGTGLGLYISRQIAREAGGDLMLDSAPPGGARFVLSLPAAAPLPSAPSEAAAPVLAAAAAAAVDEPPPSPPPSPSPARPAASLAGLRVLIVDDEEAVRRPMAKFLARRGARVNEAADGEEALAWLGAQDVDLILVDLRMPRMTGVELFDKLEQARPGLAARVMFLSGDVSQLSEPGNTPVPRERVLVKPLELGELERRILAFVRSGA
ncbi:MAG: hypothetical protein AUG79_04335 [Gemmatimonadetes bacterium 13_1_20CM_4_69_16]|nr:MAG: hypothetical protein AUG79_04335 [Gemmatimonadetes bacterium 13_1_20CM_4_69_16]